MVDVGSYVAGYVPDVPVLVILEVPVPVPLYWYAVPVASSHLNLEFR